MSTRPPRKNHGQTVLAGGKVQDLSAAKPIEMLVHGPQMGFAVAESHPASHGKVDWPGMLGPPSMVGSNS